MGSAARREPIPFPDEDDSTQLEKPPLEPAEATSHEVDDLWFAIFARLLENRKKQGPGRKPARSRSPSKK